MYRRCIENGLKDLTVNLKKNMHFLEEKNSALDKIRLFSLIINIKKLTEFQYFDIMKRNSNIADKDFDLLIESLDTLFLKGLELMSDIDIDNILRYNHIDKSLKYLSNKYIREKSDELIANYLTEEKIEKNKNINKIPSKNI